MRWKSIGLGLVVLAGVGAGLGFAWPFTKRGEALKLPGTGGVQEVQLAARVPGRVKEVLVTEADAVKAGQVLVRLEVPELEAQREVLRAKLRGAEADLKKAENGPREEEKEAAREAVKAAQARH